MQAATLVALVGFFGLVLVGFLTYQSSPPIPGRVATAGGQQLFTGADIRAGQDVFLRAGLMEYGSIFGHGAYLGPDFTADYLRRSALSVTGQYGGAGARQRGRRATRHDFKTNRYDRATRHADLLRRPRRTRFARSSSSLARSFRQARHETGATPARDHQPTDIEHR